MSWSRIVAATVLCALLASVPSQAQTLLHEFTSPHEEYLGGFGSALSGVEDVDGDGRGDLLVGALQESLASVFRAGRAYVFSGSTGALLHELQSPNAEQAGNFGSSVSGVPDVDGDGRGDLLVGAYKEEFSFGRVYLFSGATGALLFELQSPNPEYGGLFGYAVAGVPDLDGDGRGDLLIGAWGEGYPPPYGFGRAYVFSGATGALLHELHSPNEEFDNQFGWSVAGVSDADGDGRGDLLIGAYNEDGGTFAAGQAYLFSGTTGALLQTLISPTPEPGARFGSSVSGVPDADGDGRGDLLVGGPRQSPGSSPSDAGRAYLFSGATGALLFDLASPEEQVGGFFGDSVSGVEDVDGDGRGDLLVGTVGESLGSSPSDAGRAYLFSGATGALLYSLASPHEEEGGYFGTNVAGVPDADGDGRGDLLIAASEEQGTRPEAAGNAYLFSGASAPPGLALSVTALTPLTVAPGGSVAFAYTVTNTTAQSASGDLFFGARRGGAVVASGVITSGTVAAGQSVTGTFTQRVPGGAPAGTYRYAVSIGRFPSTVVAREVFTVEVTGAAAALGGGWAVTGASPWEPEQAGPAAAAASEEVAVTVSPNPFAGQTEIAFWLEVRGEVSLAVYDVRGREVARLAEGTLAAGRHAVRFAAGDLPSGVYVWRLVAGGQVETGRLTLVQ